MKRLRLVKVVVQPVFALDDGDTLTEKPASTVEVPAADWPQFIDRLEAERVELEAELNSDPATNGAVTA